MSIYLPFGIALFQASMVQLHSVSDRQRKLLDGQPFLAHEAVPLRLPERGLRGLWKKWCAMTQAKQTEILIGVGMLAQVYTPLFRYFDAKVLGPDVLPATCDFGHLSCGPQVP